MSSPVAEELVQGVLFDRQFCTLRAWQTKKQVRGLWGGRDMSAQKTAAPLHRVQPATVNTLFYSLALVASAAVVAGGWGEGVPMTIFRNIMHHVALLVTGM